MGTLSWLPHRLYRDGAEAGIVTCLATLATFWLVFVLPCWNGCAVNDMTTIAIVVAFGAVCVSIGWMLGGCRGLATKCDLAQSEARVIKAIGDSAGVATATADLSASTGEVVARQEANPQSLGLTR